MAETERQKFLERAQEVVGTMRRDLRAVRVAKNAVEESYAWEEIWTAYGALRYLVGKALSSA